VLAVALNVLTAMQVFLIAIIMAQWQVSWVQGDDFWHPDLLICEENDKNDKSLKN